MLEVKCRKCGTVNAITQGQRFDCGWCGASNSKPVKGTPAALMAIVIVAAIVIAGGAIDGGNSDDNKTVATTETEIAYTEPQSVPVLPEWNKNISSLNYYEIRASLESMTEASRNAAKGRYYGARVYWGGYVDDVTDSMFSDRFTVFVDMDAPGTPGSLYDFYFEVPASEAFKFQKGDYVEAQGGIESIDTMIAGCRVKLNRVLFVL